MPRRLPPSFNLMAAEDARMYNFGATQIRGRAAAMQEVRPSQLQIIQSFTETLTSIVAVGNGQFVNHAVTVESKTEDFIIQEVEWGVFVNSATLGGALIPYVTGVSTPTLTDWQIVGPFKSLLQVRNEADVAEFGGTTMPKGKTSERMIFVNISAGTVNLIILNQIKYIANKGGV